MLSFTTVVIRGLFLWYYKSFIRYIFCRETFKAFLEGQMTEDKSTPLLAIKKPTFLPVIFFMNSHLFLDNVYSTYLQVISLIQFNKSLVTVFKKKQYLIFYPRFFTVTKNVNGAPIPTEMNQTCCIVFLLIKTFVGFVKPLNISLDDYSLFNHDSKRTRKTLLVLLSGMIIIYFLHLQISGSTSSDLKE